MDVPLNCDMLKRLPLIVVLGATGTGKSKLAIQLAKIFNGEVISADSMQVYCGLDIVTNKVTPEEADGVPHHCLDFLDPLRTYTVVEFRNKALPIVERLMSEGKMPVVVGGTHYYIESLLWQVLVGDGAPVAKAVDEGPQQIHSRLLLLLEELEFTVSASYDQLRPEDLSGIKELLGVVELKEILEELKVLQQRVPNMSEDEASKMLSLGETGAEVVKRLHPDPVRLNNRRLHARLREVDYERAEKLHYNDVRKIRRSLEIYFRSKRTHSEHLKAQQQVEGGSELGGPLRYPGRTAVFWITAEQGVLDDRLDKRVDDMISRGLIKELEDFHKDYNEARIKEKSTSLPYTQGIFQSIGFKEFHSYLILDNKTSSDAEKLLQSGIQSMKIATRRYARRQLKWIKGRFLRTDKRQVPPVFGLDATDPTEWDTKVLEPAIAVVKSFLGEGESPPPLPVDKVVKKQSKGERLCRVCMRIFIGDHQWEDHLKSKKHHAMVRKKEKKMSTTDKV